MRRHVLPLCLFLGLGLLAAAPPAEAKKSADDRAAAAIAKDADRGVRGLLRAIRRAGATFKRAVARATKDLGKGRLAPLDALDAFVEADIQYRNEVALASRGVIEQYQDDAATRGGAALPGSEIAKQFLAGTNGAADIVTDGLTSGSAALEALIGGSFEQFMRAMDKAGVPVTRRSCPGKASHVSEVATTSQGQGLLGGRRGLEVIGVGCGDVKVIVVPSIVSFQNSTLTLVTRPDFGAVEIVGERDVEISSQAQCITFSGLAPGSYKVFLKGTDSDFRGMPISVFEHDVAIEILPKPETDPDPNPGVTSTLTIDGVPVTFDVLRTQNLVDTPERRSVDFILEQQNGPLRFLFFVGFDVQPGAGAVVLSPSFRGGESIYEGQLFNSETAVALCVLPGSDGEVKATNAPALFDRSATAPTVVKIGDSVYRSCGGGPPSEQVVSGNLVFPPGSALGGPSAK